MFDSTFMDYDNTYRSNSVTSDGGVIGLNVGVISAVASSFTNNTAQNSGGVLSILTVNINQRITFEMSSFCHNRAENGGSFSMLVGVLNLIESSFSHNGADRGGVLYLKFGNNLTVNRGNFVHNKAEKDGGVIYSGYQSDIAINNSTFNYNRANLKGGVFCSLFQSSLTFLNGNSIVAGNEAHSGGGIYAGGESKTVFQSQSVLMFNNTAKESGGSVYLSESELKFSSGRNTLVNNEAGNGGAVCASASEIVIETQSQTTLAMNTAAMYGGGLYLSMSTLTTNSSNIHITQNTAEEKGGGLYAISSSIMIVGTVRIAENLAKLGGGISIQNNTKIFGESGQGKGNSMPVVNFTLNSAAYHGGAIFVEDATYPDVCNATTHLVTPATECFFMSTTFHFSDNSANISGSNLFGGLLDRCTVNSSVEFHQNDEMGTLVPSGLANFLRLSNTDLNATASYPVRVCFCRESQPDCSYVPSMQVQRGQAVQIKVTAYDQVNHTVSATIQTSLNSTAGGLGEGEQFQHTNYNNGCTELQFHLYSPLKSEEISLAAKGPCADAEISKVRLKVNITCACPIGLQITKDDKTGCICDCDPVLQSYGITQCNSTTQTVTRVDSLWINYTKSGGYLIHPYCPYDYCQPPWSLVNVNLSHPSGSDAQCASNRSGVLCATCKPGLSVSLGSSLCMACSPIWPALLVAIVIASILAGILLVALLLVLNLTVAVGTLNAVIFYADIVAANKSVFFSTSDVNFASVVISWLNFDLGFDTCFFDGMDTYIKTWLLLAFPVYVIFLVASIIKLSYHFTFFGRLIGKKDPVATLATLILLSYTKLLQTTILAFSSTTLSYSNASKEIVWLSDATVGYLHGKHTVLFVAALVILLLVLAYTVLLFSWQWCQKHRCKAHLMKLHLFIETYHAPYMPKHRYWTGLLLLVRVSVYLVSAANLPGDPRIALSSTIFIVSCLLFYKAAFGIKAYKSRSVDVMETFTYLNIIVYSIFIWCSFKLDVFQAVITNISVGIIVAQTLFIISFHVYRYTLSSKIHKASCCKNRKNQYYVQLQQFQDHIAQAQPTFSVVELPPPPLELNRVKKEPELNLFQQNGQGNTTNIGIQSTEVSPNLGGDLAINSRSGNEEKLQTVEVEHL